MAHDAEIAWNGRGARIVIARAALLARDGREVIVPCGGGAWRLLDRTPVSARLARGDGATARFEVRDDHVLAEIAGEVWEGREGSVVRLDAEVRDGDVVIQDRT